jgi:Tctex-1 family
MDELQTSDELTFIPESIEPICLDVIEAILKDKTYNDTLVQGWIDEICSRIAKELIQTNKPFKYAGTFSYLTVALLVFNTFESLHLSVA